MESTFQKNKNKLILHVAAWKLYHSMFYILKSSFKIFFFILGSDLKFNYRTNSMMDIGFEMIDFCLFIWHKINYILDQCCQYQPIKLQENISTLKNRLKG